MTTYRVAYNHTSSRTVADLASARSAVLREARQVDGDVRADDDLVYIRCEDGIYVYLSQDAADADETGAAAFACISRVEADADVDA